MNSALPLHASNQPRQAILFFLLLMLGNLTAQAQNNWTGNTNRDWNTAGNWSAGLPTATSDVVIPSAPANQPVLSTTATAKSVEVQAGASLSISNSGSLTLNGSKPIPIGVLNFTCTFLNDGSVNNSGQVVIGSSATASVGDFGIRNVGTFQNNSGGSIAIDRTTSTGLFNVNGSFSNSATITIGAVASVGEQGILNQATFANNTGGSITIDQISLTGLINNRSFTNSAQITIRAGRTGISNGATNSTFQNTGCAALINIVADAYILNIGTFSNGGTIIENATGNSSISSNAGLVQNLNGGTFNIGTNTGVLTTTPGPQPTIAASPSLTITQGQSATLTASGAIGYSWSTGETTPAITVSATGPYSVTGTTGGCSSKATVGMTVVPTFMVSNPAICPGQFVNLGNYVSNKSPITGDLTYYTSQANAQAGTNALISGLVGPVNVPVTYYVRYDAAGSFSIQPIMVTLKPALPAPPVLTQDGHAYTGGVSSLTVAQNSESVILAVPGCDGTVSWSGPNNFISFNSTISVPTSNTGSFTYQASCSSQTACFSGSSQATVTVNVAVPVCGPIVYVTPGGAGSQNGSSWGNAFAGTGLQTAINTAAGCGAQVWVAAGLYKPTTTTGPNSRTVSFSMANSVAIYGGFVGSETALTERPAINLVLGNPSSTTLSGDIGAIGNNSDNSYHVILNPRGLTTSAILDGFLITGGNANVNPDIRGGGVLNQGGNTNNACSPTFRNCLFRANSAVLGGAMYNQASGSGTSSPVLINCSFQDNSASQWGGAMLNDGFDKGTSSPVLTNCSFQGNSASANGGGALYNEGEGNGISLPMLTNCVVFGNGGANTFFNNRGTTGVSATYSLFDDAVTGYNTGGTGNLTTAVSPFVSASSVALTACSAAINVGDPSTTTATVGATDLAGNNRIVGGRVDMGAVEYQGNPFSVSITANPSLTITQGQSITLTALGADSYRWSSGETTAAISVSVARPYSVTGTTTAGCSSVASVTLTVNAPGCGAGLSGPIWTGCVSTDWNTAGNWASGTVPTATDDVVIPSTAANQPVLSTAAVAKSVEVQSGASLSISSAGSLTITDSRRFQTFTASFWNKGRVVSGGQLIINNPTVSVYGLVNSGNFDNVPGGQIRIDGANSIGLYTIGGSFVNSSTITIGNASQYGVFNRDANFSNSGCSALLSIVSNAVINTFSGTFSNGGTIIENASGNSSISTNAGLVQNLNGGTFNIGTNTGVLTTTPGNQPTIVASPSLTITQGQSATLTASGAQTYSWSNGQSTSAISVSVAGPYSVTGTIGSCSSVTTVTLTVNAPVCGAGLSGPIWTGCVSTDWNTAGNWASGTVPTATDDVVIPSGPTNQPILSTTATAKSVEVQTGASLSISSAGRLTINSFATLGGFPSAFYNQGTVNNNGTLMLGNTAPVGLIGLHNIGTFTNTGTLQVDRATNQGINNRDRATFTNTGSITIGASVPMGTQGIWNQATFTHTGGTITIDRITGDGLLNSGSFVNSATITIGASASVTGNGIQVTGGSFQNNTGGFIQIDRTASHAIASSSTFTNAAIIKIGSLTTVSGRGLELGGAGTFTNAIDGAISLNRCGGVGMIGSSSFINSSTLTIGDIAFSGQDNIYLGSGTFTNTATGEIRADRAFGNGIWNVAGTFRNDGKVFIGSVANTGGTGILNTGTSFSNTAGASILLDRVGRGLTNTSTFTNAGQVRMGSIAPLRSSGILNGNGSGNVAAVFNNLAGGLLQIDQTAAGQDGITNEVMTTFANAGTVTIGTSGTIGGNGITNAGTVSNSACATLTVFAPVNNSGGFTNASLFTVGTTRPHTNTGTLTNNGIIDYPQGNPIPNVVNNDVIVASISSPTQTFGPALQLGGSSSQFTVGTTWYSDPALTQPAGTYNQGTNTFTATSLATGSSTTLYFAATDNTAGCTRTVAISLMVVTPCGSVVYVTPTGAGAQNGSSWTNAFSGTVLQTAINTAAGCGAQVWVAAGTYKPTTTTGPESRTISFSMANGVAIYGGLTGTEPPGYDMALRDLTANKTTLSGDIDGVADVVTGSGSTLSITGNDGNAYHVINNNNNGLTSSAILDGFTISGGNASLLGTDANNGGGMYNSLVSPTIRNCLFYANSAVFTGGAMYNTSSTINMTNCRFLNNKADVGGAIQTQARLSGVTVNHTLLNCSFTGNVGTTTAGAINHGFGNSQGQGLFDCTNCTFTNNYAFNGSDLGSAGAFFNEAAGFDARFTNCLFDGNKGLGTQADEGGGALLVYSGTVTVLNSTFVNNGAATKGGAIRIYQGQGTVNVKNSVFRSNTAPIDADISTEAGGVFTIQNSLLQVAACPPNVTCGPGMIYNQDPLFVNPGADNYQLTACSPAIDAGDPATTSATVGNTDLAGNSRFYTGGPVDMGAYEFQGMANQPIGITSQPVAGSMACAGSTVTATISVSGTAGTPGGPFTYQWYKAGSLVSNQTSATLSLTNVQTSDAGSYSVVVTGACNSVTSTAFSLTVNPTPEPPTLVAGDGQSAVTVSANTGDVVLTVSGCTGGQITWSGGGATTLAVSTAATGVFTYTATCQLNGCTSPLAIATVTVTSTSLRVLHRDASNGQLSTNAIYPYFMLDNVGSTPIAYQQITVRYWLTVENPAPVTNLPVYGAEMGAANVHPRFVSLDPARPGATAYVEYSFDAGAGLLAGNRMSGSVNTAISKQDYSVFGQGDDYSFMLNRDFVPNPRMTAYLNGVLVWGTEPDGTGTPPAPTPLMLTVSASPATLLVGESTTLTARAVGGTNPYSYQFQGPGTIRVSGNTATVSGLSAGAQTFTVVVSDAGTPVQTVQATVRVTVNTAPAPANTPPTTTANASQTATVGVGFRYTVNAFTDAETPDNLTYSARISPANGLTYNPVSRVLSGIPQITGVSSVTITATDPGGLSTSTVFTVTVLVAPEGGATQLRVLHRDASNGQLSTNAIYPYFMLDNVGSTPIAYQQITVRYWLTVENPAPVTNLPVYGAEMGAANVHPRFVSLDPARPGATAYVEYSFDAGAGLLAGNRMSGSVNTAISKQDYSVFGQGDDYSFMLNRDFVPNPRMTAYLNGVLVWGTEPAVGARLSAEGADAGLRVRVLGNPVEGGVFDVRIEGAAGQTVGLSLIDLTGGMVLSRLVDVISGSHQERLGLALWPAGGYLLRVTSGGKTIVLKVVKL